MHVRNLFGLILTIFIAQATQAAAVELTPLHIPKVTRAPRLSDFVEDVPREAETEVREFLQFDPHDGEPVSQPTRAFLSYDDKNLYVGWICKDDPEKIRARVAPRKQIMSDDRVTITIDTFQDHKHAYWFDVNPYGIQFDGRTTDGIGDDPTWEGLWYSEGKITEDGYVVLETIPFKTLRFPRSDRQVWNIALARMIQRTNEFSSWPRITHKRSPEFVGQFAPIELDSEISPGRNIQLIPYEGYSRERFLDPNSGFREQTEALPGLDAKFVLRDALTLDMTANPDFSEIGSDDPKVTVNQRYEVIYPERRPFFLENASVFSTPEDLFFSRRIIHPQFGAKLTGSLNRWNVGGIVSDDRAPGEIVEAGEKGYGKRAIDGVVRAEREFGHQSHVGLMLTDSSFVGSYNRVGSVDLRYLAPRNWTFSGQATTTQTKALDGGYSAGPGYEARIRKSDSHTWFSTTYLDRNPGMNATLGYLDRVDIRTLSSSYGYEWKPKARTVQAFGPSFSTSVNHDHEGRLQNWSLAQGFDATLPNMTYLSASHVESFERYSDTGFRKNSTGVFASTAWLKWMETALNYSWGRSINYYPPDGMQPFLADSNYGTATVTLYPKTHLRLDEIYYYWRLRNSAQADADALCSANVFTNHVMRSKVNYQFNREYAFRAIFDYNALLPNSALVSNSNSKTADTTLLFSYLPHPGTAVYMGYSDTFQNVDYSADASPAHLTTQLPGVSTDRQVFVKVSYLLRF
jgi:hypothetical protein